MLNTFLSTFIALLATVTGTVNGSISHTEYQAGASSTISISAIPTNEAEFDELASQIGSEPQGAVALCVVAMEMYHRYGESLGTACLSKCNTDSNMRSYMMKKLKDILGSQASTPRPYQMASFFKGASNANGYNPSKPLTLQVSVSKVDPYQKSVSLKGTLIYLRLKNGDPSAPKEIGVEVIQAEGEKYYKVSSCSGLYSPVKEIPSGTEFKGL